MPPTPPRPIVALFTAAGLALIAGFFAPWLAFGGESVSGLTVAWEIKKWLFVIPAAGALLAFCAATGSRYTRVVAVATGVLVIGDIALNLLDGVLGGGADTWLLVGGAGLVLAGIADKRRGLRAIGGAAVLLGFFAPWTDASLFTAVRADGFEAELVTALGITTGVLWAIPIAGVVAIGATIVPSRTGRWIAGSAGLAVFAAYLWTLGSLANVILGWGAWTTLAASTVALVLGVIAPGRGAPAPAR